ncbi:hypothetical protein EMWEY_00052690 [Eimeria maxima]|uniref:Uncharacterized protein n=1 Tax=Eimeria maxima TaxID=5804 RepID=U6M6L6_EIMMA|nr:hypothetical protein EMWEY_00052690 [Eimeria maxima]CDJ58708.1 hypothetical protein EMWEY_00052690 [Eimeria maxima]
MHVSTHCREEPEALPPLLLFCQLYLDLSKQQTKAAHLVAVGGRAQNTISGLKAGGLKIALLRVGEVLEGLAQQRRLDAFCWWLLASIRRAQQRASEAIAALLECIRICPSFAAAWEDLTEVLAAQVFSPGRAHSPLPWAGPDSAAAPAAAAAAALVGAAVRPVVSGASGEGASAPAADERQRKNDGASQNQQQQHEQHSMQTDTHPACNQDVASSDTLSSSSSSSGVDASEVLQQEERQRRGLAGAEGTRGKCVISAAAQAAAAAIAAEGEAADETTTTATTRTTTTKTAAVVTSPTADGFCVENVKA